jgi:uncharacterized protein (UPF0248 family)
VIKKILQKIKYELQFNNTQYYTRVSERVLKGYYKKIRRKQLLQLPPLALKTENAQLTLSILASKKNFDDSLAAMYSLCFWRTNIKIHYHEDGSLQEEDIAILNKLFPGIKVFRRKAQNEKVINYLNNQGLTYCAKLRESFVLSLKLIDTLLEKDTPYMLMIDSDVLFFSRPDEIFKVVDDAVLNGCYNVDIANVYSFTDEILSKYLDNDILNCVNTGVFLHNFDKGSFAFMENILANELKLPSPWHMEQTLFAMYATKVQNFIPLPAYYDLARQLRDRGKPIVSEHYVHHTGYNIQKDFIDKLYPLYRSKQAIL